MDFCENQNFNRNQNSELLHRMRNSPRNDFKNDSHGIASASNKRFLWNWTCANTSLKIISTSDIVAFLSLHCAEFMKCMEMFTPHLSYHRRRCCCCGCCCFHCRRLSTFDVTVSAAPVSVMLCLKAHAARVDIVSMLIQQIALDSIASSATP